MSLRNFSTVAGLLLAGVLTACVSTEETGGGPKYKYPTESSFCAELAKVECNTAVVTACYSADNADNKSSCVSARSAADECRASATGVANPGSPRYNPATAETCLAKQAAVYTDAKLTRDEIKAADEACIQVFSGPGTAGSTCSVDVDCDTTKGYRCITKAGSAGGTCAEPNPVGLGDDCTDAAAQCDDGQFCGEAASGLICQKRLAEGKTCTESVPCLEDLKCDSVDVMTGMGTCAAKLADTASCTADDQCSGSFCDKDPGATSTDMGICVEAYILNYKSATCDGFKP